MENPLLERIINGPPRAAEKALRAQKGPIVLFAIGLLINAVWMGVVYFHYIRVGGNYLAYTFWEIGTELILTSSLPMYFPHVDSNVAHLVTSMTPEQIYLSRICAFGVAVGTLLIFVGPIWTYCRLYAAKRRSNAER
jgi:hypothetical protein